MQHICIAPKNSRRAKFWQQALAPLSLIHISYTDLVNHHFSLEKNINYIVRIESPGEDDQTTQLLESIGRNKQVETKNFGQLIQYDDWYKGWLKVLNQIELLRNSYQLEFINSPKEIALVFDKKKVHRHLNNVIEMPTLIGTCNTWQGLNNLLTKNYQEVFVKARYGSSASGVIAIRKYRKKIAAYTSLTEKNGLLYNSLKLKKYTSVSQLEKLMQKANMEFIIEEWVPKMTIEGANVDFRVVIIDGKAEFIVPRRSKHMITNIHLGGEKLMAKDCSSSSIDTVASFAETVSQHFTELRYAGYDILLTKNKKPMLIEVNAFGDMLLNTYNKENNTTYEMEAKKYKNSELLR